MAVNPVGAVPIFDGGTPRILTARAAVGVTGGQLIYFSGGTGNLSSGADTFASSDINIIGQASGALFNGIVLTPGNTASGTSNYVAVGTAGTYISTADGTVTPGRPLTVAGVDSIADLGSFAVDINVKKVGRALTAATSGTSNFAAWSITL